MLHTASAGQFMSSPLCVYLELFRTTGAEDLVHLCVGSTSVDGLASVRRHLTNQALRHEVLDGAASEGTVHTHALGDDGRGDQLELGHLSHTFIIKRLVEEDGVDDLLLDLALRPLLLLGLATAAAFLLLGGCLL